VVMKYFLLTLKLILFIYLCYLCYFLAIEYNPVLSSARPPFFLWVIDIINLFIHEAGHFFFRIFGQRISILGGSVFQCLVPLALVAVTLRQNPSNTPYAGFWLGENLVNVSIYIKDAPFQQLHLIGKGLIHDWHWLLSNNLDTAEPLGDVVCLLGILICVVSIGAGVLLSIRDFRWYQDRTPND
jgi:hypothetical protein